MVKYIVFKHIFKYFDYCLFDITNNNNVVIINFNFLQRTINKLTFLLDKTLKTPLSFNNLFFYFLFKKIISSGEIPIFLFFEYNLMSCNKIFLINLKKIYPDSKIVYYLTNSVGKGNPLVLNAIKQNRSLYDMIITYNREDALKYNLTYHHWMYSQIYEANHREKEYDLFFIGQDKGRLNLLSNIADICKKNHIIYDFNVLYSNHTNDNKYNINIIKKQMSYGEIIEKIKKSKCVLELVPYGIQSWTLRTAEIIATGTKLLTNNTSLKNDPIFNEHQMSIFTSADDIDINFLKKDAGYNFFCDRDLLSPKRFLQFLEINLFQ